MTLNENIYFELSELLSDEFSLFNQKILEIFDKAKNELTDDIQALIFAKSKHIRSLLIFLFAKAMNIKISDDIINIAVAVELIHNATLIHDDIIDEADLRRSIPTLNSKFNSKLAVISGDLLLTFAMQELVKCNNNNIINLFSELLKEMCLGEINQYFNIEKILTIDEYILKSKRKTASLFEAGICSLGILTDKNQKYLKNFSVNYGIAFQIRDDLMNIINNDKSKPELNDVKQGIYTAPVIYYFENQNLNMRFINKNELIKNIQNSDSITKTKELIQKYINVAIDSLVFLEDNNYKNLIIKLCNHICRVN